MGDAGPLLQGHLLLVLPFPEVEEDMAPIRRRFPELKITYLNPDNGGADPLAGKHQIPDGEPGHAGARAL